MRLRWRSGGRGGDEGDGVDVGRGGGKKKTKREKKNKKLDASHLLWGANHVLYFSFFTVFLRYP